MALMAGTTASTSLIAKGTIWMSSARMALMVLALGANCASIAWMAAMAAITVAAFMGLFLDRIVRDDGVQRAGGRYESIVEALGADRVGVGFQVSFQRIAGIAAGTNRRDDLLDGRVTASFRGRIRRAVGDVIGGRRLHGVESVRCYDDELRRYLCAGDGVVGVLEVCAARQHGDGRERNDCALHQEFPFAMVRTRFPTDAKNPEGPLGSGGW